LKLFIVCCLFEITYVCMYVSSFENDVYLCLYNVCVFIWNSKCMCIGGFHNDLYLCLYNVCVFIWNCKCMCIGAFDNPCFLIWNCVLCVAYLKLLMYVSKLVDLTMMFTYVCIMYVYLFEIVSVCV